MRLHGICVVDSAYTDDLTAFVILLPSLTDLEVLQGPPWWNAGHIVGTLIGFLLLILAAQTLYGRIERWRLLAVCEERERLAHEMHDTLAQSFAGIAFQLEAIRDEIHDEPAAKRELDRASVLVRHSHDEAKRSIAALRPELLESHGLLRALEMSARHMTAGSSIQVLAFSSGEEFGIPTRVSDTLFRIGQEALANAARHAHPTKLRILLAYERAIVRLQIEDDGKGFVSDADSPGFGIRGMRKRADYISAELEIRSAPEQGTTVRVLVPLPGRQARTLWPRYVWHLLWEYRFHARPTGKGNRSHSATYR